MGCAYGEGIFHGVVHFGVAMRMYAFPSASVRFDWLIVVSLRGVQRVRGVHGLDGGVAVDNEMCFSHFVTVSFSRMMTQLTEVVPG